MTTPSLLVSPSIVGKSPASRRDEAAADALQDCSLEELSLDEILTLPRSRHAKHPHKDVLRLSGIREGASETVYVKRQWAWDRRLPRWSDWRDGVSFDADPVREERGLRRMHASGLQVPAPLRLLTDDDPRSPRAALLMSAVPIRRSLADWAAAGALQQLSLLDRRHLIVALSRMAERVHQSGLRWRSMKAKHIYPLRLDDGRWQLWLIDCEGVRPRAWRSQQRRDRRLLVRSVARAGGDAAFVSALATALTW